MKSEYQNKIADLDPGICLLDRESNKRAMDQEESMLKICACLYGLSINPHSPLFNVKEKGNPAHTGLKIAHWIIDPYSLSLVCFYS
jgi:hypothetical protein